MITGTINDLMSDTDASSPQRPELPKKRLFTVLRSLASFSSTLIIASGVNLDPVVMIEAHGFLLDQGVLYFYEYTLNRMPTGLLDDPFKWVFVQYSRRAFAPGAWLEVEEKVMTVAGSQGVN